MSDLVWVNTKMPREMANELQKIAEEMNKKSGGIRISRSDITRIAVTKFIRDYKLVEGFEISYLGNQLLEK